MEELHAEQSAELSKTHIEERYDSCEICKKTFSHMNNLSPHTSEREREIIVRCETLATPRGREMQIIRGRKKPFIRNLCKKDFTERFNLELHTLDKDPFPANCVRKYSLRALT
jgi:hypothetical protein